MGLKSLEQRELRDDLVTELSGMKYLLDGGRSSGGSRVAEVAV